MSEAIKQKPMGTILVVDDVPENIATLAGMLRDNYRVLFATSGADALEIVRQQQFDLILLDVMMPGMDGYEVCRRLKADIVTREIPVIFVTALTEVQDETRGLELGAVDFLHKPCHAAIVRLRVQLHIERHNRSHSLERLVQERTRELDETRIEIVRRLGRAAEYRDNETGMHVIRMSKSSRLLARAAGVSERQANLLLNAAPMHDIGKIGIPDRVLIKPGPLDQEEWALMKTHPLIGAEIIGDHPSELLQMARIVALTHHEKWDGSGYPHGVAGDEIPLEGRIVTIADVFDALTSERPYKKAWSTAEAVDFMRDQAGTMFDPGLLHLFLNMIPQVEDIRRRYADTP
ncbi:MAG: two-component system response regulator [Gammaproteobacteria bacterium]|nr:two-component system response regulator [Gammaproteobacteria bacterium]MBU1602552.1 two-component system response regulator [Gammaproteobacteria bacterium]MBU2433357.1 two-component system response regulator [Gammaproteobacteria bacterium]MBU2451273.1 two-component system response regulator [Gammaproteobacteria bacterium]